MPITVKHGPSAQAVGTVAYEGGYMQGRNRLQDKLAAEEQRRYEFDTRNAHQMQMAQLQNDLQMQRMEMGAELQAAADQRRAAAARQDKRAEREWRSAEAQLGRDHSRAAMQMQQDYGREMDAINEDQYYDRQLWEMAQKLPEIEGQYQQKKFAIAKIQSELNDGKITGGQAANAMRELDKQFPITEGQLQIIKERREASQLGVDVDQYRMLKRGETVQGEDGLPKLLDPQTGQLQTDYNVLRAQTSIQQAEMQARATTAAQAQRNQADLIKTQQNNRTKLVADQQKEAQRRREGAVKLAATAIKDISKELDAINKEVADLEREYRAEPTTDADGKPIEPSVSVAERRAMVQAGVRRKQAAAARLNQMIRQVGRDNPQEGRRLLDHMLSIYPEMESFLRNIQ